MAEENDEVEEAVLISVNNNKSNVGGYGNGKLSPNNNNNNNDDVKEVVSGSRLFNGVSFRRSSCNAGPHELADASAEEFIPHGLFFSLLCFVFVFVCVFFKDIFLHILNFHLHS